MLKGLELPGTEAREGARRLDSKRTVKWLCGPGGAFKNSEGGA